MVLTVAPDFDVECDFGMKVVGDAKGGLRCDIVIAGGGYDLERFPDCVQMLECHVGECHLHVGLEASNVQVHGLLKQIAGVDQISRDIGLLLGNGTDNHIIEDADGTQGIIQWKGYCFFQ